MRLLAATIIALTVSALSGTVLAQRWAVVLGDPEPNRIYAGQPTSDGGFVIAGSRGALGASDVWVVKLNLWGHPDWELRYGDGSAEEALSVTETSDGGFAVAGYKIVSGVGAELWVLKLSSLGAIEHEKRYGGATSEFGYDIRQAADDTYVVAATRDAGAGLQNAWVLKLSSALDVVWQREYGGAGDEIALSVEPIAGGYVVAGTTGSFSAGGGRDAWVFRLDADGNLVKQRRYGSTTFSDEIAWAVRQATDGGFVVAGESSLSQGIPEGLVFKTDPDLNLEWINTYSGGSGETLRSVEVSPGGGYIVAGESSSCCVGGTDLWVMQLDDSGTAGLQRAYGGLGADSAWAVRPFFDPGSGSLQFFVAGVTDSFDASPPGVPGESEAWALRMNSLLQVQDPCPLEDLTTYGEIAAVGDSAATTSDDNATTATATDTSTTPAATGADRLIQCSARPDEVSARGSGRPLRVSRSDPLDTPGCDWEPGRFNGAESFEVIEGDLNGLPFGEYGQIFQQGVPGPSADCLVFQLGVGEAQVVLVRGMNPAGTGPLGFDSFENERCSPSLCAQQPLP